jgi:hypothetical protein
MSTLPTGVYANLTTPLWATAGAGQEFVSPSVVVNDTTPATAQVSIIVNNDTTGAIELNTIPTGTAINEVRLEGLTNGIGLYTNGEITMVSAPNSTAVLGDLQIVSRQTGGTWNFNNNELSYNNTKQLTGDTTFTQLGENTYSDAVGLNVWNVTSSNSTTTIGDTDIEFYTSSGGSNFNQTFSFVSQLVPNFVPPSANPDFLTPNARTPIFPNDAQFDPNTASSLLNISGGSGTPYSIQITNNGLTTTTGIGCSIYKTDGNNLYANNFPFWIELTMFDPSSIQYGLFNTADLTYTNLITQIKNVAGTLSFVPYGSLTPTTFVVGDKVRVIYEWLDKTNFIPQMIISKNNIVLTRTILPAVPIGVAQYEPTFYNTTPIVAGYIYNVTFNYGNTSPIIASFNDWEWTTGLGGLYDYGNTSIAPAPSGSSPNSTTYWSIVYLKNNCTFTSPPIIVNQGIVVTISAYKGSRFGLGTLNIYQNNTTLVYSGVVSATWTQTTLGTYTSTGSDTLTFQYSGSLTDTLSLQRINLNYNNAVDILIGGIGKSGTAINMGYGNFLSTPSLQLTSSIINAFKPINMSNNNISNVGTLRTNTITDVGGAGEINVTASFNMYNYSLGNVYEINTQRINPVSSNIIVGGNFNLSNHNISNVLTLSTASVEAQNTTSTTAIYTPYLNSTSNTTDLYIGSSATKRVNINNAGLITGNAGGSPYLSLQFCELINGAPACATGSVWYTANFGGYRNLACPLPPTQTRRTGTDITAFSSVDDYITTIGYTLPPYSELVIFGFGSPLGVFTNNSATPQTISNNYFTLDNPNIAYTLKPYLTTI